LSFLTIWIITKIPFRWNGCDVVSACYKGAVPLERARNAWPCMLQRCRSAGTGAYAYPTFVTKVPFRWNGRVMLGLVCYKGAVPLERARMHVPRMLQRCRSAGTGAYACPTYVTKVPFRWNGRVMLGLVCYKGAVPLERVRNAWPCLLQRYRSAGTGAYAYPSYVTKVPFRWNGRVCISHACYKGAVPLERARMHVPRMLQRCRSAGTGA